MERFPITKALKVEFTVVKRKTKTKNKGRCYIVKGCGSDFSRKATTIKTTEIPYLHCLYAQGQTLIDTTLTNATYTVCIF